MPPQTLANPTADLTSSLPQYLPLLVIVVIAALLAGLLVGLSWILGPKRSTSEKLAPYECGVTPVGSARERFPVKFYLIAMLFIIFDIETVFLYPWAVTFTRGSQTFRMFELGEMVVFIAILLVGYVYVWGKGALEWE